MPHRTEKRRLRAAGNTGCLRPVHADARSANVVVVVMAAVCIRAIAVDAFAIADLVAAVCRLLVNAIVMGAARMIQRISQRYGRRSRGPSGKWCNKAASASVLKAYCVRFHRTAQPTAARSSKQRSPLLRSRSSCPGGKSRFRCARTAFHLAPARGTGPAQPPPQEEERPPVAAAVQGPTAAHCCAGPCARPGMHAYGHGLHERESACSCL
jgi:hypothetical protein